MRMVWRRVASVVVAAALAVPGGAGAAPATDGDARIVHVLNRLGYGPRPGDLERVRRIGVERWIQEQLRPERIQDDAVATRLASLKTVGMDTAELVKGYEIPREAKREMKQRRAEMGEGASEGDAQRARRELIQKYAPQMAGRPRQVVEELQAAKILRAVYSERQLDEVLVDFWLNHFNVFANKGPEKFLVGAYEREVIRPHAWGRFEDLLKATAESPAMLFYLDNWLSADPAATAGMQQRREQMQARRGRAGMAGRRNRGGMRPEGMRPEGMGPDGMRGEQRPAQGAGRKRGLNENYARELMELHTLGVDGGYTQKDVTEVARAFTGWTIREARGQDPTFAFDDRLHDRKDKVVLGRTIRAGGKGEGDQILHLLATHPATARFISFKLARRFVADEPPPAVVARAAETFSRTGGDIRAVVTAIVTSPEFLAPPTVAAKVKTPFEFVASAMRATGADVRDARDLAKRLGEMGMPLYQQQPPTGYKDTADAWVSTSGLLARLNLALDLAAGRVRGVTVDPKLLGSGAALVSTLVPQGLSPQTTQTLEAEGGATPARLAGLVLGSPEFQRR